MIKLLIQGNVTVEGASNNEEAIAAVKEVAGGTNIESVTRGGPDAGPVYAVRLKMQVVELERAAIEEAVAGAEVEKKEFTELGDEAAEEGEPGPEGE